MSGYSDLFSEARIKMERTDASAGSLHRFVLYILYIRCGCAGQWGLLPHLFHCLAYLGGLLVGRVAYGNEGYGFQAFGHGNDFVELVDVEVAHPAGAKALLGGCQAEVLDGNGQVNVGMGLGVIAACPALCLGLHAEDDGRDVVYPVAVVGLLDTCKEFGLAVVHEDELPGLAVDGRGCKAHTLADVVQLFRLDGTVLILAAAVACLAKVFEIHSFFVFI